MNGSKSTTPTGELEDLSHLSHHPTRKVDSMSSLVAEMLLRDSDPDATAPALPAAPRMIAQVAAEDVRSKSHATVWLVAALAFLVALAAAAILLSR